MAGGHGWGGASQPGSNHPALGLRQRCPSLSQEGSFLHTLMTPRLTAIRLTQCCVPSTALLEERLSTIHCKLQSRMGELLNLAPTFRSHGNSGE
jgi:hypothetical protein